MSPGIAKKSCMEKDFINQIWFSFSLDKLQQMNVIWTITYIIELHWVLFISFYEVKYSAL